MRIAFWTFVTLVIAIILVGILLVVLPYTPQSTEPTTTVQIEQGASVRSIAVTLQQHDVIRAQTLFVAYVQLTGRSQELKAGDYAITTPISIRELVRILSEGEALSTDIAVTIPEGSTIADIDRILAQASLIESGTLLTPEYLALEGYLFPDTYRFAQDAPLSDIIQVLQATFDERVGTIDEQTLIIASMVEREVRSDQDMQLVAGIMYKRLEIGMPLQIDATVAYGVCRPKFEQSQQCTPALVNLVDNIPVDTPYNTYTRADMPIGPISNPGLRAIEAAKDPQESEYLYYLSAKDGTTIFSQTLNEHNRARQTHILN